METLVECFQIRPCDAGGAQAAFAALKAALTELLPAEADIQHVGATAIPGCLTKGDLDLCVRVAARDFAACEQALAARLARNDGSARTDSFAAFHAGDAGIQLVAIGTALDIFTAFRDRLTADPELLAAYNALKRTCDGWPMDEYRAAKAAFIAAALARP